MGRYVPPELEGVVGANQASGKGHALGNRARKAGQGILTVRFEMPYAIWCSTCPKPTIIGQGVRFNAEKKKVGNYYSSPIYSFRMKHVACGGSIEIRTDPQTTTYIVTEGATKRDTGEGRLREGDVVVAGGKSEEERQRLETDPFARLEESVSDRKVAEAEKSRVQELYGASERWDDPAAANQRLRKTFRVERKLREKKLAGTEALKNRLGLAMDVLDESNDDVQRAKLIDFGADISVPFHPLFQQDKEGSGLRCRLEQNTRLAVDPFLHDANRTGKSILVKRRPVSEPPEDSAAPLVDYDSD